MSRFKHNIKDYFSFSRGEFIGISVLVLIIIIILIFPNFYKHFKKDDKPVIAAIDKQLNNSKTKPKYPNDTAKCFTFPKSKTFKGKSYKSYESDKSYKSDKSTYKPFKYSPKNSKAIEINSADSLDLMSLRGIGYVYAKRIINYRKLLGGYCQKEQLLEVWGMDTARYNMIKSYIEVNRDSIHKININKVSFKKLIKHPYIKFEIAKAISDYKNVHGDFKVISDMRKCSLINDSIFRKLSPYIDVK